MTRAEMIDEAVRRAGHDLVTLGRTKIAPNGALRWSLDDFSRHNIAIPAIRAEYRRIVARECSAC